MHLHPSYLGDRGAVDSLVRCLPLPDVIFSVAFLLAPPVVTVAHLHLGVAGWAEALVRTAEGGLSSRATPASRCRPGPWSRCSLRVFSLQTQPPPIGH